VEAINADVTLPSSQNRPAGPRRVPTRAVRAATQPVVVVDLTVDDDPPTPTPPTAADTQGTSLDHPD